MGKKLFNKIFGITKTKRAIAKATGIPTTKGGRKAKIKKVTQEGAVIFFIFFLLFLIISVCKEKPSNSQNAIENRKTVLKGTEEGDTKRTNIQEKDVKAIISSYIVEIEGYTEKPGEIPGKKNYFTKEGRHSTGTKKIAYFIRILPGYKVTLFDEPNYKGKSLTLTAGLHDLRINKFHNCLMSMIIEKDKTLDISNNQPKEREKITLKKFNDYTEKREVEQKNNFLYPKCSRCGGKLNDAESINRGYGPECWRIIKKQK